MAESTLALKLSNYQAAVGYFLGYGRGDDFGETAWTTPQRNSINEDVDTGLRRFYFPSLAQNASVSHVWSFLKPTATLSLHGGQATSDLPDDFKDIDGPFAVSGSDGTWPVELYPIPVGRILSYQAANPTATGKPQFLSIEPIKGTTALASQRFRLLVYPIPDDDYTLACRYTILPNCLTTARPYCYGGMEHDDTIKESCLAAAELSRDDTAGVHERQFQMRLAASISMDRGLQPQMLGYNGDSSVRGNRYGFGRFGYGCDWRIRVSVNGVYPG